MNKHIDAAEVATNRIEVPGEPYLDPYDPASGELAAQWLYRNGLEKLAAVVYVLQLGVRAARIRELAAQPATAPTLDAELAQDRMSELCELERDVLDSLPAVYYMDPPDGGNVSLGEQVKRMAEDAALWRKHSSTPAAPGIDLPTPRNREEAMALVKLALSYLGVVDAHIDAAILRCETDASPKGGSNESKQTR